MAEPARMLPGEDRRHDIAFAKVESTPLSDGASASAFAQRVNTLMREHIPCLSRSFDSQEALAKWVTTQVPSANRQEARNRWLAMTAAEQKQPHLVVESMVELLSEANPHDDDEDINLADEEYTGGRGRGRGRRPNGLNPGSRGGSKGKGKGKGIGRAGERATACSVEEPRGPTCTKAHKGPCWRDPRWPGPLPAAVHARKDVLDDILKDRLANARRLGEECVELAPPEDIGSLDIDDVAMIEEQWPDGFREANVDACSSDDVSIASSDGTLPVARVVDSSPTPLALVRSSPPPSPAPMQTPVATRTHLTSPTWADVRVNLSVPYAEIEA